MTSTEQVELTDRGVAAAGDNDIQMVYFAFLDDVRVTAILALFRAGESNDCLLCLDVML